MRPTTEWSSVSGVNVVVFWTISQNKTKISSILKIYFFWSSLKWISFLFMRFSHSYWWSVYTSMTHAHTRATLTPFKTCMFTTFSDYFHQIKCIFPFQLQHSFAHLFSVWSERNEVKINQNYQSRCLLKMSSFSLHINEWNEYWEFSECTKNNFPIRLSPSVLFRLILSTGKHTKGNKNMCKIYIHLEEMIHTFSSFRPFSPRN